MKFKFKNHEDYLSQRNAALAEAEAALTDSDQEKYNERVQYVNDMDAAYEEYARQQANIATMRGAVKVPVSTPAAADMMNANDPEREYRVQFMNFVLKGTPIKMSNTDAYTVTTDVSAVIPRTIVNKIIEKMEKVGVIYAKMTKTYYQGGVVVPTSAVKPVATWTTERGKTDKQKKTTGSVTFAYHKLRCVVAVSLAVATVTLEVFEDTLVKQVVEAMIKEIENAGFNGTGGANNQPEGILLATPVSGHVVEITEGSSPTYENWLAAEGALEDAYDAGTEWYMRKKTYFGQVLGMKDLQGQPIARVNVGIDGKPSYELFGRKVNFTEHVPAFATSVSADTPFAAMFRFEDYILNVNLDITVRDYIDEDTDDKVKKAVMLVDGKPVDLNSLVVVKVKNS
ncbi:MAG: phage major capsid protein [Lachnospiraceae bacterium]|nr:phage major capsid protein [Lachnospiraceae bacterium]